MEEIITEGWIILNDLGQCLNKGEEDRLSWIPEEEIIRAHVWTETEVEEIRERSETWDPKPSLLIPARFEKGIVSLRNGWSREF